MKKLTRPFLKLILPVFLAATCLAVNASAMNPSYSAKAFLESEMDPFTISLIIIATVLLLLLVIVYALKKRAEESDKSKTEYLLNMSHDIRTPMNAIMGYTDLAMKSIEDDDKTRDCLQKIKASGEHMLSLVNNILELNQIESGEFKLSSEPVDIREVISKTEQMGQALAMPKNIILEVIKGDIKNPYLYTDEAHLNEVLINIISNAIQYSPEGGTVKFEINQIGDKNSYSAKYRFKVSDNGNGMSEDELKEGANLGLSIVRHIVNLAGGAISIQCEQNQGTIVTTDIPFKIVNSNVAEGLSEEHTEPEKLGYNDVFAGKRVLLVEDNELNREISEAILSQVGLTIEGAEDGSVAVEKFTKNGEGFYDFILMDIQMPVMDGYEATKAIRQLPGGDRIPIIAVSANAFKEDRQKSLESGMDDHIAKPIDVMDLFDSMKMLM